MAVIPHHFQINFLVRKWLHFYQNLSGICSWRYNQQWYRTGWDIGLAMFLKKHSSGGRDKTPRSYDATLQSTNRLPQPHFRLYSSIPEIVQCLCCHISVFDSLLFCLWVPWDLELGVINILKQSERNRRYLADDTFKYNLTFLNFDRIATEICFTLRIKMLVNSFRTF